MMYFSTFSLLGLLAGLVAAKTDLDGCTRTDISSPAGASYAWIVPGTGELCDPLNCGGGRAPPKTTVPGCAAYVGTETYSPSYLAGFAAPATAAASASAVVTSAEMTVAATATPTADASDDEDDSSDDDPSDDEEPLSLAGIDSAQQSTYMWRTADNPTATLNPFTASAFPSDVSTFWIPVDLGSTTSWEAAVPTILPGGYTDIVPASLPASSDLPAICAIATNSGCGISMSTMTVSRSGTSPTELATLVQGASSTMGSMSRGAGVSGQSTPLSVSASGSASKSASASTGAAGGNTGCAVGGILAGALGVLVVM